jgi:hypothetical protein
LQFCYRNTLRLTYESSFKTLVLTPIYTPRKRYPRNDAAHIVLRTVRRFLDKYGDSLDRIVFAFDDPADLDIYNEITPLYFPRTNEELLAALEKLPEDVGNETGETVIAERKIRISSFPIAPQLSSSLFQKKVEGLGERGFEKQEKLIESSSKRVATHGFNQMVPDQDALRVAKVKEELRNMNKNEKVNLKYERLLRDSREEDLSDIAKLGFIYKSGRDVNGRVIVVIVARHLPVNAIDMNRVLLYIIRVMDSIVERDYSVVYVHSNVQSANQPKLKWMQEVTAIFNRKYKKNLKKFYVVHPSFWVKMVFWTLSPVVSDKFWGKLIYINTLGELEKYLEIDKLGLTEEVKEFDRVRSGSSNAQEGRPKAKTVEEAPVFVPGRLSEARKEL